MDCKNCEYETVCNGLLYTQVRLGITTCRQGRYKRGSLPHPDKNGIQPETV